MESLDPMVKSFYGVIYSLKPPRVKPLCSSPTLVPVLLVSRPVPMAESSEQRKSLDHHACILPRTRSISQLAIHCCTCSVAPKGHMAGGFPHLRHPQAIFTQACGSSIWLWNKQCSYRQLPAHHYLLLQLLLLFLSKKALFHRT